MWCSDSDRELPVAAVFSANAESYSSTTDATPPPSPPASLRTRRRTTPKNSNAAASTSASQQAAEATSPEPEAEDVWRGAQWEAAWPGRHHPQKKPVVLAAEEDDGSVGRSRSLTNDDLEELKGCADLGFGFSYDEIPELRDTLPALELCYSMTQKLLDDQADAEAAAPVTNWKISSPGDSPDEVKARLKYWAQAVACTVRLCS